MPYRCPARRRRVPLPRSDSWRQSAHSSTCSHERPRGGEGAHARVTWDAVRRIVICRQSQQTSESARQGLRLSPEPVWPHERRNFAHPDPAHRAVKETTCVLPPNGKERRSSKRRRWFFFLPRTRFHVKGRGSRGDIPLPVQLPVDALLEPFSCPRCRAHA